MQCPLVQTRFPEEVAVLQLCGQQGSPFAAQVLGSSAAPGDAASRGDVIRGDRIPQEQQHVRILHRGGGSCFFGLMGQQQRQHQEH